MVRKWVLGFEMLGAVQKLFGNVSGVVWGWLWYAGSFDAVVLDRFGLAPGMLFVCGAVGLFQDLFGIVFSHFIPTIRCKFDWHSFYH